MGSDERHILVQNSLLNRFLKSPQLNLPAKGRHPYLGVTNWYQSGLAKLGRVTAGYLHTNEGSDPVLLETLGIKSDLLRGINDPGVVQAAKVSDDSRIKRLAQHVLNSVPEGVYERAG